MHFREPYVDFDGARNSKPCHHHDRGIDDSSEVMHPGDKMSAGKDAPPTPLQNIIGSTAPSVKGPKCTKTLAEGYLNGLTHS